MADGFSLTIDDSMLKKLDDADKKLTKMAETMDATSKRMIKSFQDINSQGLDVFMNKMNDVNKVISSLGNKKISISNILGGKSQTARSVDDINKLIELLNKLSQETKKTQGTNKRGGLLGDMSKSVSDWQALQKQISDNEKQISKLTQSTREYESTMKRIQSGKGGVIHANASKEYQENLKNIEFLKQQNALLQQKQQLIIQNNQALQAQANLQQQLKQYTQQQGSLPEQRKADELKRMNDYYRELEKSSKKASEEATKSAEKETKSRERALRSAQKQADMEAKRQQRAAQSRETQILNAYNQAMKANEATVNQRINKLAKLRQVESQLAQDEAKYSSQLSRVRGEIDRLSQANDKAAKSTKQLQSNQRNLMDTTGQLQRKLALLFSVSAIQGYISKLIDVRGEFEMQQKSLQILLKDKDEADKLWQQTLDFAVKSPFRVKELVNYTKQLAAYRIETSKLHQTTKMLSDVSAGLGVDMQRIILAFGQVRAAQFLRGTELRQFTEAGIPMLDELANLFTELEGRAVSTGEVFERISKRMVLFKDVEQVFERMTSASGIFYKMQEEQSKTLAGMISNLHDSMDIMLNDIGKANEKNIKDLIQMTRTMIDNWRMIGVIIKEVGAAFLLFNLSKFAAGWRMAAGAIAMSDITMKGIAGTAGKLRVALSTLFATIAANPFTTILAASGAAIYALWEYSESINAVNKKYDEMSIREVNVIDKLEALNEKAQENNTIIENNKKSVEERNKAEKENLKILKEVKTKYPELAHLISKQEDGTISLTKAIEAQNEKLIENIALQQKAKGRWFYDSLDENYKDAIEDFAELQSEINSIKVISAEAMAKLSQADISSEDYKKYSELLAEIRKSKDFDSLKVAYNNFTKEVVRNGKEVTKQVPLLGMFAKQWFNVVNAAGSYKQAIKDLTQSFERQKDDLIVGITDAYNKAFNKEGYKNEDEAKEAGANAAGAWIEGFLDDFGIIDENIREWAKIEIPKFVTVDVLYPTKVDTPQDLEDWAKRVKEAITKVNDEIKTKNPKATQFDLFPLPDPGQTREQYLNIAKSVLDIAKATYAEGQQIEDEATVNRTKMLSGYVDDVEKILNIIKKETTKGAGKDWMSEVVKGIKEAHQEYIKLNKTLGESESKQMALGKYAKSFAEAAKNAGLKDISLGQFSFETEEGAIDALEYLKDKLPESAKQARFKLEEAIGEIHGEVRIRTKAEDDKMLIEEIEDMFSGYEMSIELQKLNIPKDLAKQLFNVDSVDLSSIRNKISSELAKAQATGGQEDLIKELEKQLGKVEDLENKAQQERLKKYTKYLLKAQSERVKIKLEEMSQLAEIEKLGYTDTQKQQITQAIKVETQQKLDKEAWESFKNTDFYIQMFEDLGVVSDKVLNDLKTRLIDIRGSLSDLSPRELKEVVSQLEKVTSEQISRNPFENLGDTIDKGVKALKRLNQEQEEYSNALKEQDVTQKRVDSLQIANKQAEAQIESAKAILLSKDATIEQRNEAQHIITTNKGAIAQNNLLLDVEIKRLATQKGITEEAAKKLIITRQEADAVTKTVNKVASDAQEVSAGLKDWMSTLELFGVEFDENVSHILNGYDKMWSALAEIDLSKPMTIVTGSLKASAGLAEVIGSLFGFGNKDKKKEKQIQREIKFVEDLQRTYQKLEKQIDKAYEFDTLKGSYDAAQKNIDEQIASYNKMIAAEEDKKKTDKDRIKEWQLAIEDLSEQRKELLKSQVEELGGGYDYSSMTEDFVNAWLDAFKDTGNGLKGLEENFEDFWTNIALKQAVMGGASKIMQPFLDAVNKALENDFKLDDSEMANIDQLSAKAKEDMNAFLEQWYDRWGDFMTQGEQSELSGLQRGIQGVTEETAQIIEAYLNSVRFYVADSNTKLTQLVNQVVGGENTPNPMLSELKTQTEMIRAIRDMFSSVIRNGHPTFGGAFIKVAL